MPSEVEGDVFRPKTFCLPSSSALLSLSLWQCGLFPRTKLIQDMWYGQRGSARIVGISNRDWDIHQHILEDFWDTSNSCITNNIACIFRGETGVKLT